MSGHFKIHMHIHLCIKREPRTKDVSECPSDFYYNFNYIYCVNFIMLFRRKQLQQFSVITTLNWN